MALFRMVIKASLSVDAKALGVGPALSIKVAP